MDERSFDPEIIQRRIKQLRKERNMSQNAFSKFVGSSAQSNVNAWENGDRIPGTYFVFQIAVCCNVSADWILGLTDERNPVPQEVKA